MEGIEDIVTGRPYFQKSVSIICKNDEERTVTGVVMVPFELDTQGEFALPGEIRKAAHKFLALHRLVKFDHRIPLTDVYVVESWVTPVDIKLVDQIIKADTWLITTYVGNDELWSLIKSGELESYSVGGYSNKTVRDYESYVGQNIRKWLGFDASQAEQIQLPARYESLSKSAANRIQKGKAVEMQNIEVVEISFVKKGANKRKFAVIKKDEIQKLDLNGYELIRELLSKSHESLYAIDGILNAYQTVNSGQEQSPSAEEKPVTKSHWSEIKTGLDELTGLLISQS